MSWAAFIPIAIRIITFLLDKAKASADTRQAMLNLIASTKDDGLISIAHADKLQSHHSKILEQIAADKKAP